MESQDAVWINIACNVALAILGIYLFFRVAQKMAGAVSFLFEVVAVMFVGILLMRWRGLLTFDFDVAWLSITQLFSEALAFFYSQGEAFFRKA